MRRYIPLVSLCVVVSLAGSALATTPLPPFEESVTYNDADVAFTRSGIVNKNPPLAERCIRDLFCVGPYDPDIHYEWGTTGVRVLANDTNLTLGHDPTKHFEYGPYVVPLWPAGLDDLRACWNGCTFPNAFYGSASARVQVMVYLFGAEYRTPWIGAAYDFSPEQPGIIPETYGCNLGKDPCPQD